MVGVGTEGYYRGLEHRDRKRYRTREQQAMVLAGIGTALSAMNQQRRIAEQEGEAAKMLHALQQRSESPQASQAGMPMKPGEEWSYPSQAQPSIGPAPGPQAPTQPQQYQETPGILGGLYRSIRGGMGGGYPGTEATDPMKPSTALQVREIRGQEAQAQRDYDLDLRKVAATEGAAGESLRRYNLAAQKAEETRMLDDYEQEARAATATLTNPVEIDARIRQVNSMDLPSAAKGRALDVYQGRMEEIGADRKSVAARAAKLPSDWNSMTSQARLLRNALQDPSSQLADAGKVLDAIKDLSLLDIWKDMSDDPQIEEAFRVTSQNLTRLLSDPEMLAQKPELMQAYRRDMGLLLGGLGSNALRMANQMNDQQYRMSVLPASMGRAAETVVNSGGYGWDALRSEITTRPKYTLAVEMLLGAQGTDLKTLEALARQRDMPDEKGEGGESVDEYTQRTQALAQWAQWIGERLIESDVEANTVEVPPN